MERTLSLSFSKTVVDRLSRRTVRAGVMAFAVLVVAVSGTAIAHAEGDTTTAAGSQHTPHPQGVDRLGRPLQPGGKPADPAAATVSTGPPISRNEILARAQAWLAVPVPYSQN